MSHYANTLEIDVFVPAKNLLGDVMPHTHMPSLSRRRTAAYVLELQRLDHRWLVSSGRARRGRGESLLPLGQARRAVARLQEGALQLADVGLVLDHLFRRRGVLQ